MTIRGAVLRSLLVVVAGGFSTAGKVSGSVASRTGDEEEEAEMIMTPPGPLGPAASAGRQAIMTGVGPGPASEQDD
ncbi:hypothetical protein ACFQE8_06105 [Salinirubellus sp. GCM10025818]|uniref:hypothetical protein n=1 Tax=Salinirubellus TaxID=2162630 RepID=UPI0030D554A0